MTFFSPVVQSKKGEPLLAEIDLNDITIQEQIELRAGMASADIYKVTQVEYPNINGTPLDINVELMRREVRVDLALAAVVKQPGVNRTALARAVDALFSNAETMILDEPTNHLDADSVVWLREFLKGYQGGLIVISHDVDLVEETVNRVFYLDAMRGVIDVYNMGWKHYLKQREADEEREEDRGRQGGSVGPDGSAGRHRRRRSG